MAKWIDFRDYQEWLQELGEVNIARTFNVATDDEAAKLFLVEVTYLNYWDTYLEWATDNEDAHIEVYFVDNGSKLNVRVSCDSTDDYVVIVYDLETNSSGRYNLEIYHNCNLAYWRTAEQDPATEWQINELANNVVDETGKYLFSGEPYSI